MSEVEVIETSVGSAKLQRTGRRTLAIHVLPDGSVELTAPLDATAEAILTKVEKRSRWIATQRRAFREMNVKPTARRYVSGATHRYLGRQYRLKISHGKIASVRLRGGFFEIVTPNESGQAVKELLTRWFRERAKDLFTRRMEAWKPWCKKHHLPEPQLRILTMRNRWGSAETNGRISINPELIHAPTRCIDYVIAHEICHLRYSNHGLTFTRQLAALMPDWRTVKERLEQAEF